MRNRIHLPLCALAAALISVTASAATVMEIQSAGGRKSTMTVENDKARLQSEFVNYSLMYPRIGQYLYVAQDKKQIVKIYDAIPAEAVARPITPPPPSAKLVRKGPGPKIAGYPTQQYQLFASGSLCLTAFLSREAMEEGQLKQFHVAFYHMQMRQKQMAKTSGANVSSCSDAEQLLMEAYPKFGLAMRTLFPDGKLRQEILSVKTDVTVANDFFQPPQGLKQISHEEFMRARERPKDNGADTAKELTKSTPEAKTEPKQDSAPAEKKDGGS